MIWRILIIITYLSLIVGCSDNKNSERLSRIDKTISESPQKALASLDSIDYNSLTNEDKQYFDFLTIKAKDKAFIHHTSDSLVLKVIEQEARNSNNDRYNEALYYGGRVYHDLGDLPTALNYYQSALDNLKENEDSQTLRGSILSQISGVLNSLRLYDQAISYIKEVIYLDSIRKDYINLMYDTEFSGKIHLHAKKYEAAESFFKEAKKIARELAVADTTRHNMYLAAVKYNKNQIDSALTLIRPAILDIDSISRNVALAYACEIYKKAGIPDTVLLYANELIRSKNPNNRKTGYKILLSDDMKDFIPADSVLSYAHRYRDIIESYLNQNGNQAALIQNSFYNYQLHQQKKSKAEAANKRLFNWLSGFLIVILVLSICVLYLKNKNKSQLLQLHEAINNVNRLRKTLYLSDDASTDNSLENQNSQKYDDEKLLSNINELRRKLGNQLLSIGNSGNQCYSVPQTILESGIYDKILECLKTDRVIPENSHLWIELEETVLKCFPDFKKRLRLLTGGKIKTADLHLVLLVKCGITSTDISKVVGRAKSTIAYRKDALGIRVYGEKIDTKTIDNIIHLL